MLRYWRDLDIFSVTGRFYNMLQYHLLRRIQRPWAYETHELPLPYLSQFICAFSGIPTHLPCLGTIDQPAGAAFIFVCWSSRAQTTITYQAGTLPAGYFLYLWNRQDPTMTPGIPWNSIELLPRKIPLFLEGSLCCTYVLSSQHHVDPSKPYRPRSYYTAYVLCSIHWSVFVFYIVRMQY
jgi:hypothetical protein